MNNLEEAFQDIKFLNNIRTKFQSGNEIPVTEACITRQEWEAVDRILKAQARDLAVLESKLDLKNWRVNWAGPKVVC